MKHVVLTTVLAIALGNAETAAASPETTCLRIVSTASTKAALENCGCRNKPLGGLAKRATLLAEDSSTRLLVDAGNWADNSEAISLSKTRVVWDAMSVMGYQAATLGAAELTYGVQDLQSLLLEHPEISVVSSNIRVHGELLAKPYSLHHIDGVNVAVTGVTGASGYRYNVAKGKQSEDVFSFDAPAEALKALIPELQQAADVVVVLAAVTPQEASELAESVQGVDVMVVGQNPRNTSQPELIAQSLVVQSGSKGKYLGSTSLCIDAEGNLTDYEGSSIEVKKTTEDHSGVAELVKAWKSKKALEASK